MAFRQPVSSPKKYAAGCSAVLCLLFTGSVRAQGRELYEQGRGQDVVEARLRSVDSPVESAAYPCAGCHGPDGRGTTEGGVRAASLTVARTLPLMAAEVWLTRALRSGVARDGHTLHPVMPRYRLSTRDTRALLLYLRTLPYPDEPGVSADAIQIGLDLADADPELQRTVRAQLNDDLAHTAPVFGRKLVLQTVAGAPVLLTIALTAQRDPPQPELAVRPLSDLTERACVNCCGTTRATIAEQTAWLEAELSRTGGPVFKQDAQAPAVQSSTEPASWLYLDESDALHDWLSVHSAQGDRVYALKDLTTASAGDAALIHWVVPLAWQRHVLAVRQLTSARPDLSPPAASTIIELRGSLLLLTRALREAGRHLAGRALCRQLERETRAERRITIRDPDGSMRELGPY